MITHYTQMHHCVMHTTVSRKRWEVIKRKIASLAFMIELPASLMDVLKHVSCILNCLFLPADQTHQPIYTHLYFSGRMTNNEKLGRL